MKLLWTSNVYIEQLEMIPQHTPTMNNGAFAVLKATVPRQQRCKLQGEASGSGETTPARRTYTGMQHFAATWHMFAYSEVQMPACVCVCVCHSLSLSPSLPPSLAPSLSVTTLVSKPFLPRKLCVIVEAGSDKLGVPAV